MSENSELFIPGGERLFGSLTGVRKFATKFERSNPSPHITYHNRPTDATINESDDGNVVLTTETKNTVEAHGSICNHRGLQVIHNEKSHTKRTQGAHLKGGANMSAKGSFKYDESQFKPNQREAAIALVEREFSEPANRKTKDDIANELGITRQTLYNWNTKDSNFIAYKNYLASEFADSNLAFVYTKLLDAIGKGSVRAMETFLKRIGDLDTQTEVTIKNESEQSFDERKAALMERLKSEGDDNNK